MKNQFEAIINRLNLTPHIEGGYFRRIYQSPHRITLDSQKNRSINSSIYYLLGSDDFSCWHRLSSDEIWHYYCGSNLTIYQIDQQHNLITTTIGNLLTDENVLPQCILSAGTWFAAKVASPHAFTLIGCTVAPGFDYEDMEIGKREELLKQFPQHKDLIFQFTR